MLIFLFLHLQNYKSIDLYWPIIIIAVSQMTLRQILAAPPTIGALNACRQQRLTSLVCSIPFSKVKVGQTVFMLTQYALGVDYINHAAFSKSIKGWKAITQLKRQIKSGELTLTGKEEPFERFLIKALATGKSWEQLIHEHRISKVFIHIQSLWHHREYFIMYICDSYYLKEEARYLAFRCIFRTTESINDRMLAVRDSHYYKTRLNNWLSKEFHEIDKLEDRLLSLLIQSVKKEMTLAATFNNLSEHLNFQWINKFCELHWLNFLCFQLQSGQQREIFKTCELRRKITWKKFDRHEKPHYNGEVVFRLKKKLQDSMKNCERFEDYFVDELQVLLLYSIREEIPWLQVKEKINSHFSEIITQLDQRKSNTFVDQSFQAFRSQKKMRSQLQSSQETLMSGLVEQNIKGRKRKINDKSSLKYEDSGSKHSQMLSITNQQMQTLSLIQKTKDCYDSIQNENFKNLPNESLAHYIASNKKKLDTLAEQKLRFYRQFPQKITEIQHTGTKKLMMSLLAFEAEFQCSKVDTHLSNKAKMFDKQKKIEQTKRGIAESTLSEGTSDQIMLKTKVFNNYSSADVRHNAREYKQ